MTKWILVALILMLAVGTCFGQTAQPNWYFGGARLDFDPAASTKIMAGSAISLGKGFLLLPQFDVPIGTPDSLTRTSALTGDIAKKVYSFKYGSFYVLMAGSVDWVNIPEGDWQAYGNAAIGGFYVLPLSTFFLNKGPILTYLHDKVSVYVGYRYKSDLRSMTKFPDGSQFGLGVAVLR